MELETQGLEIGNLGIRTLGAGNQNKNEVDAETDNEGETEVETVTEDTWRKYQKTDTESVTEAVIEDT